MQKLLVLVCVAMSLVLSGCRCCKKQEATCHRTTKTVTKRVSGPLSEKEITWSEEDYA